MWLVVGMGGRQENTQEDANEASPANVTASNTCLYYLSQLGLCQIVCRHQGFLQQISHFQSAAVEERQPATTMAVIVYNLRSTDEQINKRTRTVMRVRACACASMHGRWCTNGRSLCTYNETTSLDCLFFFFDAQSLPTGTKTDPFVNDFRFL